MRLTRVDGVDGAGADEPTGRHLPVARRAAACRWPGELSPSGGPASWLAPCCQPTNGAAAACVACGPHQVSTGAHACGADVCATANVSANACIDCAAGQIVGGADGNSCVACPPLQIPNADGNACVACGPHQIGVGTACVDCPNDQVAMPDNTCQACPDGQIPYEQTVIGSPSFGTSCLPTEECTCTAGYCRGVNSNGICQDIIG